MDYSKAVFYGLLSFKDNKTCSALVLHLSLVTVVTLLYASHNMYCMG